MQSPLTIIYLQVRDQEDEPAIRRTTAAGNGRLSRVANAARIKKIRQFIEGGTQRNPALFRLT